MWRPVNCISWCGVYTILQRYIAFPYMAYILYFLMWHTFFISWCGVYHIGSPYMTDGCIVLQTYIIYPVMAYIRFSWCSLFLVIPDVAHIALCLLIWSIYCSSDINDNFCYVAESVLPDVACFLHFLMWCSLHCRSWSGVYIVLQLYITFPDMAYILYFLMWRTFSISWCGVQYIVSSAVAFIFFVRHR